MSSESLVLTVCLRMNGIDGAKSAMLASVAQARSRSSGWSYRKSITIELSTSGRFVIHLRTLSIEVTFSCGPGTEGYTGGAARSEKGHRVLSSVLAGKKKRSRLKVSIIVHTRARACTHARMHACTRTHTQRIKEATTETKTKKEQHQYTHPPFIEKMR